MSFFFFLSTGNYHNKKPGNARVTLPNSNTEFDLTNLMIQKKSITHIKKLNSPYHD